MGHQVRQSENQKSWQILTGSSLKVIAVCCMLLDHLGATVVYRVIVAENFNIEHYDNWRIFYMSLRNIGRIAFPIFCFLLVEGFLHTRNRMKYAIHLLVFAFISEIPFDLAISGELTFYNQNVYFTLFIGLLVIWGMDKMKAISRKKSQIWLVISCFMILSIGGMVAVLLKTDYHYNGVLLIVIFYIFGHNRMVAGMVGFISFLWEIFCFPAFLLIQCYNGKRGLRGKYIFYFFYPVHLLILYLLTVILGLAHI